MTEIDDEILLQVHRGCGFWVEIGICIVTKGIIGTEISKNRFIPGLVDIKLILPWWSIFTLGIMRIILCRIAHNKTKRIWDLHVPRGISFRFV